MLDKEERRVVVSFVDFREVDFGNIKEPLKLNSPTYLFHKNYLTKQDYNPVHVLIFYDGFFDDNYNYSDVSGGIDDQLFYVGDTVVEVECVYGKDYGSLENIVRTLNLRGVDLFSYNHIGGLTPSAEQFIEYSQADSIIYVEKFDGEIPEYYQYVKIRLNREEFDNYFDFGYLSAITPSTTRLIHQFNNLLSAYNGQCILLKAPEGIDIADFIEKGYKKYYYTHKDHRRFIYFSFTEAENYIAPVLDTLEKEAKGYAKVRCAVFDNIENLSLEDQSNLYLFLKNYRLQSINSKLPNSPFESFTKEDIEYYFFRTKADLRSLCVQGLFNWDLFSLISNFSFEVPSLDSNGAMEKKSYLDAMIYQYAKEYSIYPLHLNDAIYQKLINYHYPYNVEEMKNIISNLYLRQEGLGETGELMQMPFKLEEVKEQVHSTRLDDNLRPYMRRNIESLLAVTDGNIAKAAKLAGLAINTFKQKMEECDINIEEFKKSGNLK